MGRVMANLGYNFGIPGKRKISIEELPHPDGLWMCLGDIFLVANWCRRGQPTVGNTVPRQVGLGCPTGAWESLGSRMGSCWLLLPASIGVSSHSGWGSWLHFLPSSSRTVRIIRTTPSPPHLMLWTPFLCSQRSFGQLHSLLGLQLTRGWPSDLSSL